MAAGFGSSVQGSEEEGWLSTDIPGVVPGLESEGVSSRLWLRGSFGVSLVGSWTVQTRSAKLIEGRIQFNLSV